ncbi:hypothetical protein ABTX81_10030 [Kitasatospora sp. NPDC097605]|uniref:hypothetical protein n=1 Tax=Kitasatospora sp. NPDC097605 TaxID=3157226 RepID=UPI00332C7B0E
MLSVLRAPVSSRSRPGGRNEDSAPAADGVAVLPDGARLPAALDTGCVHGGTRRRAPSSVPRAPRGRL